MMPPAAGPVPQAPPLAQRARANKAEKAAAGEGFKRPNVAQFIPPELKDTVDRIVAAGMKVAYSPEMAQERQQFIQGEGPVAQRMSENVTGLLLTLDQKAQGGLPPGALLPAGLELMSDAAEMLAKAGEPVTQEDYNDGARMLFVSLGQKMGGTPDQIMKAASDAAGGAPDAGGQPPQGAAPAGMPQGAPPGVA